MMSQNEKNNEKIANYIICALRGKISDEINDLFIPDQLKVQMRAKCVDGMIDVVEALEQEYDRANKGLSMDLAYDFIGSFMESFRTELKAKRGIA